jgi:hypothetical protein
MPGLHPFVQGLLKELPKAGDVWPVKAAILPPPGDEEYQKRKTTFWNERGRQLRFWILCVWLRNICPAHNSSAHT